MVETLNRLGKENRDFFFIIDYKKDTLIYEYLDCLERIDFSFHSTPLAQEKITLKKTHISFNEYKKRYDALQKQITKGNTYLANLTCPTKIETSLSLEELFKNSFAKYKVLLKDKFVLFSPETFVKILDNTIFAYPMKGTIDASTQNAESKILESEKELAEHVMVTDLLRNDLGIVADSIKVEKFRYIEKIYAGDKELLQVSSEISGKLQENWNEYLGEIFDKLLPAGSICGTPKRKTVEILDSIEEYERGFFTGIFGIYKDGTLESGVAIRYIEKQGNSLIFKSGGGITESSNVNQEYQEMKDKVYVPTY